jgi:hypothetical protein
MQSPAYASRRVDEEKSYSIGTNVLPRALKPLL